MLCKMGYFILLYVVFIFQNQKQKFLKNNVTISKPQCVLTPKLSEVGFFLPVLSMIQRQVQTGTAVKQRSAVIGMRMRNKSKDR